MSLQLLMFSPQGKGNKSSNDVCFSWAISDESPAVCGFSSTTEN
jgi:hypothetical protein